jgi:anti-sigma B factor antagonist
VTTREVGDDDAATLCPAGELDLAGAPAFWAEVEQLVGAGHRHLVVDLARVTLLDTATVSVLVRTSSALRDAGGTLRLVNVAPPALHVLAIVGLDHLARPPDERPGSREAPPV